MIFAQIQNFSTENMGKLESFEHNVVGSSHLNGVQKPCFFVFSTGKEKERKTLWHQLYSRLNQVTEQFKGHLKVTALCIGFHHGMVCYQIYLKMRRKIHSFDKMTFNLANSA